MKEDIEKPNVEGVTVALKLDTSKWKSLDGTFDKLQQLCLRKYYYCLERI